MIKILAVEKVFVHPTLALFVKLSVIFRAVKIPDRLGNFSSAIKSEKVEGELYHRYWIDEEYLAELEEVGKEVSEGTFFDNLRAWLGW